MFYYTEDGQVAYFPSAWTDVGQADPFVILSAGPAVSRRKADSKERSDRERCDSNLTIVVIFMTYLARHIALRRLESR